MTDVELGQALRTLHRYARPMMLAAGWPRTADVPASRVAINVLTAVGVEARPLQVQVVVVTPAGRAAPDPTTVAGGVLRLGGPATAGDHRGHLAVVVADGVDEIIVDLTIDQLNQAADVALAPVFARFSGGLHDRNDRSVPVGRCEVLYRPRRDDLAYTESAAWRAGDTAMVTQMTDELIRLVGAGTQTAT